MVFLVEESSLEEVIHHVLDPIKFGGMTSFLMSMLININL
jgi:hypothetical protein